MSEELYVVILAGGKGERFWPLSTPEHPKPFLKLFSDSTLLQQTYDRALRLVPREHIRLVVGQQHAELSRGQLPDLLPNGLLLEEAGRDTAAAIGYASLQLPSHALMLVLPADHLISDSDSFVETIRYAAAFVQNHGGPCTFGIRPDRAETNYGYVRTGATPLRQQGPHAVYRVEEFVEKPNAQRAEQYLQDPSYYWNSGMFLWKVARIQKLLAEFLPQLWEGLNDLEESGGKTTYASLQKISIDYGVMQKCADTVLIPAHFQWDDVGTWASLPRIMPTDANGNLVRGKHVELETSNCIIYAENHTMATIGVQDLIIVQQGDKTLICHKDYADKLKQLLARLSK